METREHLLARTLTAAALLLLASCVADVPRLPALDATPLVEGASTRVDLTAGYDGTTAARDTAGAGAGAGGVTLLGDFDWTSGAWRGFEAHVGYEDFYARVERVADASPGAAASRLRVPALSRLEPADASLAWSDRRTRIVLGRQAIAPGGERFVGMVRWRPGEQSYDGLRVQRELARGAHLSYTWAGGVGAGERPDAAASRWRGRFHLLDGTLEAGRLGRLQGFVYRMAFADAVRTDATATRGGAQSGATFGAAWRRELRLGEYAPLPFALSYASATRFAGTTTPGGVDTYALLQADVGGTVVELGRHDLRAARGTDAGGIEWNTTLSRRLADWLHVQARFADLRGAVGDDRRWSFEVSARLR